MQSTETLLDRLNQDVTSLQADKTRAEVLAGDLCDEKDKITRLESSAAMIQQELRAISQDLEQALKDGKITHEKDSELIQSINAQLAYQKKLIEERQAKILSLESKMEDLQESGLNLRLQDVELASLKKEAEIEEARVRDLAAEVDQAESIEASNSRAYSDAKAKVHQAEATIKEVELELEVVIEARNTFSERISQGHLLEGIELEIYNIIGVS